MTTDSPTPRSDSDAAIIDGRERLTDEHLLVQTNLMAEKDRVSSLDDVDALLMSRDPAIPAGFAMKRSEEWVVILLVDGGEVEVPQLLGSLKVYSDMTWSAYFKDSQLPKSHFSGVADSTITSGSEVLNLMATLKSAVVSGGVSI